MSRLTEFSPRGGRTVATLACAGLVALTACSEPEVVLVGKREPISSVLQTADTADQRVAEISENQSLPFAAPASQTNADWTHGLGTPTYRTLNPALSDAPALAWSNNIGAGDSRKLRITADPVVAGGLIFTLDAASQVTATNLSGQTVWQASVLPSRDKDGEATGGGLAVAGDVLYVTSGFGTLTAFDAASGAVSWAQDLDASATGRPTVFGNLVYLVAGDRTGWAIETETGRIAWQIDATEDVGNVLGGPAPVVVDDVAVFSFGSGELQAVFRRGGLRRWDSSVLGERAGRALSNVDDVTGTPVAANGVIYAGSQAGRTVALDAASGKRIWTAQEGAIDTVLPVGGSVFVVSDRNELLRLSAEDGARIWGTPLPNFVKDSPRRSSRVFANHGPILADGKLVVASGDGQLRFFNPEDGSLLSSVSIPGGATTAPVVAGGVLYLVNTKGQLLAFR
ncbi:MAG: PQQ-binding-like beta-propeller repeat protein [Rhodobacteraceae bacterium]|nr:PQQ-binding-like beta-propeller repeat protein [Paracoccaceae bacterium]